MNVFPIASSDLPNLARRSDLHITVSFIFSKARKYKLNKSMDLRTVAQEELEPTIMQ